MLPILEYKKDYKDPVLLKRLLNRSVGGTVNQERNVKKIIKAVVERGDEALIGFAKKFDGINLTRKTMILSKEQIEKSAAMANPFLLKSIRKAIYNINRYHSYQKMRSWYASERRGNGVILGRIVKPLDKVGLYVPGGNAVLFSTLLMAAIPAQIAGVREIIVCTPPNSIGVHPALAAALVELGIYRVYLVGGAQAIAAMAYGTETVPCVDKIVGPGNIYVSLAKKLVFGKVGIDMIAGPSEVVIAADQKANPKWVAADMLAQAEHGSGSETAICISSNRNFAEKVKMEIKKQVQDSPKNNQLRKTLRNYSAIYVCPDLEGVVCLINRIAPEHLGLHFRNPWGMLKKIKNAGAVFIGKYSAESVGDYFAGSNHILPTCGSARFFSPLGVYDFLKWSSLISYSKKALNRNSQFIKTMADAEGLFHHAMAVDLRLK